MQLNTVILILSSFNFSWCSSLCLSCQTSVHTVTAAAAAAWMFRAACSTWYSWFHLCVSGHELHYQYKDQLMMRNPFFSNMTLCHQMCRISTCILPLSLGGEGSCSPLKHQEQWCGIIPEEWIPQVQYCERVSKLVSVDRKNSLLADDTSNRNGMWCRQCSCMFWLYRV